MAEELTEREHALLCAGVRIGAQLERERQPRPRDAEFEPPDAVIARDRGSLKEFASHKQMTRSLINLRNELAEKSNEIVFKLNSCLYNKYPYT